MILVCKISFINLITFEPLSFQIFQFRLKSEIHNIEISLYFYYSSYDIKHLKYSIYCLQKMLHYRCLFIVWYIFLFLGHRFGSQFSFIIHLTTLPCFALLCLVCLQMYICVCMPFFIFKPLKHIWAVYDTCLRIQTVFLKPLL